LLRLLRLLFDIDIIHGVIRPQSEHESADHLLRGGLAGAVWADQAEHLAVGHLKGQAVCGYELARLAGRQVVLLGDISSRIMVRSAISPLQCLWVNSYPIDRRIFLARCSRKT